MSYGSRLEKDFLLSYCKTHPTIATMNSASSYREECRGAGVAS